MSKEAIMAAESAIKSAATVFQGTGDVDGAAAAASRFYEGIKALAGVDPAQIEAQQAAQRQANAAQNLAGATQQVQNQLGGQVVRDLSTEEARWQDALVNNPDAWYNNVGDSRASSGGGDGPDFRFKDKDADVKPLWLNGKYGQAPAWVFERLQLPFPGGGGGQAQPQTQSAPAQPEAGGNPVPF